MARISSSPAFEASSSCSDFWGDLVRPCVAEIPNLKAIHDRFSNDPRFVLVSLNLDERPDDAEFFVNEKRLRWLQGFAGPDSPVVSVCGATAIPVTFLIGPEGTPGQGF